MSKTNRQKNNKKYLQQNKKVKDLIKITQMIVQLDLNSATNRKKWYLGHQQKHDHNRPI